MTVMSGPDSKNRRPRESLCPHSTRARQDKSSTNRPAKAQVTQKGLTLTKLLGERLTCGVVLIDGRWKVAALDGQARRLMGLAPGQETLPAFEALPAQIQAVVREALCPGKAPAERQVELSGGGGMSDLHLNVVPLSPGKRNAGVVLVLNDLTPARKLEERLEQLDRLANLGTLAAAMAHEIRNALVAGKTFVDLLLEKHQDAELVEVVQRELGRIDAIVGRILKFSGSARPAFGEVRLHEVLDHSLRLVQPQLEDKLVSLSRSFRATPDLVKGDEYQLQQAFVNLFLNALEAMGPKGTLSVATESVSPRGGPDRRGGLAAPAQLRVAIRDNGAGIPPEHMGRLFELFFTTKPSGTGLGLPITRRIIQEHRGDISVESQAGKGTAFQILLPAWA